MDFFHWWYVLNVAFANIYICNESLETEKRQIACITCKFFMRMEDSEKEKHVLGSVHFVSLG